MSNLIISVRDISNKRCFSSTGFAEDSNDDGRSLLSLKLTSYALVIITNSVRLIVGRVLGVVLVIVWR